LATGSLLGNWITAWQLDYCLATRLLLVNWITAWQLDHCLATGSLLGNWITACPINAHIVVSRLPITAKSKNKKWRPMGKQEHSNFTTEVSFNTIIIVRKHHCKTAIMMV